MKKKMIELENLREGSLSLEAPAVQSLLDETDNAQMMLVYVKTAEDLKSFKTIFKGIVDRA